VARFIGYEGARRFADYIEKLTGDQEIVPPGLTIETDNPENWYLKRVRPWSSIASIAAGVNNGKMQLTNPANSGVIVVVQGGGIISKVTAGQLRVTGDAAAAGGGVSPVNGIDFRIPLDATGVLAVQPPQNTVNNALAISGFNIDFVQGAITTDIMSRVLPVRPAIVTPGHNLTFNNLTAAEATTFIAWGYSRPARPEELAL